jgi:[histone H3]-lysine79 N-trimethyltransferase
VWVVNEAIRQKFHDLKEGALVISLEPFVVGGGRVVTERNDISAILDFSAHDYHSMDVDVSWASVAVKFYVHRVDRAGYADVRARFEASTRRYTRSTRR